MDNSLIIGSIVRIKSNISIYDASISDSYSIEYPINTIGKIVHIRSRYENTPAHYSQYKVIACDDADTSTICLHNLSHLYLAYQLEKLS
jgi:hypothetical protein